MGKRYGSASADVDMRALIAWARGASTLIGQRGAGFRGCGGAGVRVERGCVTWITQYAALDPLRTLVRWCILET